MGITERKEREKQILKQQIIDTAIHMFLIEGFENTSMRKIAAEIEYSPATIYLYFKDKNEILSHIRSYAFDLFWQKINEFHFIKDPFGRLKNIINSYIDFAMSNEGLYQIMFSDMCTEKVSNSSNPPDEPIESKFYQFLRDAIRQCIFNDDLKKSNPETTTLMLWSYLHGIISMYMNHKIPESSFQQKNNTISDQIRNVTETMLANLKV